MSALRVFVSGIALVAVATLVACQSGGGFNVAEISIWIRS